MAKTAKKTGHYTVAGQTGTWKTLDGAMKAANYKPILTYHTEREVPKPGETWAAGPVPMYAPCTILEIDGFTSVIFEAIDPMGKKRKFMNAVQYFIDTYRKV